MNLGEKIKKYRILRGMKITDLARQADVTRQTIYQIERGDSGTRVETLQRIAKALDISPAVFLE